MVVLLVMVVAVEHHIVIIFVQDLEPIALRSSRAVSAEASMTSPARKWLAELVTLASTTSFARKLPGEATT
jgi:hypothetical protein